MSKPKLFRTPWTFPTAAEAVAHFNAERSEGVDAIGQQVADFLAAIKEYDSHVVYNAQPSLRTHYIAAALETDHHVWLYAKPSGVSFLVGDERNVDAIHEMWGDPPIDPPTTIMETDVWFQPGELTGPAAQFSLRLAAQWATFR